MKKKPMSGIILSIFTISILALTLNVQTAKSMPVPTPYADVTASKYTVKVGQTFDINVTIHDLDILFAVVGIEFRLTSNTPQFELLDVTEGPFLSSFPNKQDPPYTHFLAMPVTDDPVRPAHVLVGSLILPNETGYWNNVAHGTGTLATITFRALEPGHYFFWLFDVLAVSIYSGTTPIPPPTGVFIDVLPLTHDVAIVDIQLANTEAYPGHSFNVTVTAKNKGEATETFNITTHLDDEPVATQTVTNLPPNDTITLTFNLNTIGLTLYKNYTIAAHTQPVQDETNADDNTLTDGQIQIVMLGDINADKTINIKDLAKAALSFGTFPGYSRWNLQADLNQDARMDIRDLILIAKNFGKKYP